MEGTAEQPMTEEEQSNQEPDDETLDILGIAFKCLP